MDVLILAATNRDLPALIREGKFRADLFHRLATLRIEVPPLRERKEDIEIIARQRLELLEKEGHDRKLSKADFKVLRDYDWPGNVLQLLKLIDRAVLLGMSIRAAIDEEAALGELFETDDPAADGLPRHKGEIETLDNLNKRYARRAWELHGQSIATAAKALGVARRTRCGISCWICVSRQNDNLGIRFVISSGISPRSGTIREKHQRFTGDIWGSTSNVAGALQISVPFS